MAFAGLTEEQVAGALEEKTGAPTTDISKAKWLHEFFKDVAAGGFEIGGLQISRGEALDAALSAGMKQINKFPTGSPMKKKAYEAFQNLWKSIEATPKHILDEINELRFPEKVLHEGREVRGLAEYAGRKGTNIDVGLAPRRAETVSTTWFHETGAHGQQYRRIREGDPTWTAHVRQRQLQNALLPRAEARKVDPLEMQADVLAKKLSEHLKSGKKLTGELFEKWFKETTPQ